MKIKIIDLYLVKQLLFASLGATLVFSGPVILISLFSQLPGENIFTELLWPSLASIVPMILYHILPVLIASAIVYCYADFSSEGTLVTLYLAGQSIFDVRTPAFYVATGGAVVGYALSCFVAPLTAGHLHDVLHFVRHDINPAMLRVGQFNTLDGGRITIRFEKFLNKNEIAGVFIREVSVGKEEKIYVAQQAVIERDAKEKGIVLLDGSTQEFDPGTGELRTANFERLSRPLITFGAVHSKRNYIIVDELSTPSLLQERGNAFSDPEKARSWMREAVKRFGIPILTIFHTLLGLELLAMWRIMSDRQRQPVALVCGIIASIHLMVIVAAEQIGLEIQWAWAVAAIVTTELAATVALMKLRPENVASPLRSIAARAYGFLMHIPGTLKHKLAGGHFGPVVGPNLLVHATDIPGIGQSLDGSDTVDVPGDLDHRGFPSIFRGEDHRSQTPAAARLPRVKAEDPD